jgi:hypothetical protein
VVDAATCRGPGAVYPRGTDDELGGGGGIGVSFDRSIANRTSSETPDAGSWSAGTRKLSDLSGKVTSNSVAGLPSGKARVKPGAKCLTALQGSALGWVSGPETAIPLSVIETSSSCAHETDPVTVAPSDTPV